MTLSERVDGALRTLGTPAMQYLKPTPVTGPLGPLNYGVVPDATAWKCTRRSRTLVGTGVRPDGTVERTEYTVRTPSCGNRLTLSVRRRAASVRDTWGVGGVGGTVCAARCVRVELPRGTATVTRSLGLRRGERVTLRTPYQRVARTVGTPTSTGATILTTGDSMMQSLDAVLTDKLAGHADVESDVRPGAALASVFAYDWLDVARQQVAKLHPQATVVFLGMNDLFPIVAADGTKIPCCGRDWEAAYEARARTAMRIYAQGGAGSVVWLTVPYARDPRRNFGEWVVNLALRRAAATVPGVSVVGADDIFTPGGKYRERMPDHGRQVRVREPDGAHLNIPGARIASGYVLAALAKCGIIRP